MLAQCETVTKLLISVVEYTLNVPKLYRDFVKKSSEYRNVYCKMFTSNNRLNKFPGWNYAPKCEQTDKIKGKIVKQMQTNNANNRS